MRGVKGSKRLTEEEVKFLREVERSGRHLKGGSFVLSESGKIYHGMPFETGVLTIHGEENAVGNMLTAEGLNAKFKIILIVGAEDEIVTPCGRCRELIRKYGKRGCSVLCATKDLRKVVKFGIEDLLPYPCNEKYLG